MTEDNMSDFVTAFKKFYQDFFLCIADNVVYLADVQKKYSKQYKKIIEFGENPEILEELISQLPPEKQAILIRVLLKAGDFGKKFANLMEMSPEEKDDFAGDLKKFSKDIDKM